MSIYTIYKRENLWYNAYREESVMGQYTVFSERHSYLLFFSAKCQSHDTGLVGEFDDYASFFMFFHKSMEIRGKV